MGQRFSIAPKRRNRTVLKFAGFRDFALLLHGKYGLPAQSAVSGQRNRQIRACQRTDRCIETVRDPCPRQDDCERHCENRKKWFVYLHVERTESKPRVVFVTGEVRRQSRNGTGESVCVGDVFVAAGQSNMELNYAQYYEGNNNAYNFGKGLVKKTDLPKPLVDKNVKFVIADHDAKNTDFPLANVNLNAGARLNADSTNSLHLSYLTQQFALQLRAKHPNVPVGIIQTAWGGTPIRRHVRGGDIYANHIAPLKDFHVAGVLWYQGCDDAMNFSTATEYESQMTALINQYRSVFGRKDLPFLYVQLARWPNYQYTQNVREAQRTTLGNTNLHDSSNVAMTVSLDTDKGTSALIHPLGKDILGARMAAQYLAMEDGTTVPNGPLIEHARHTANGAIALSFRNGTASGLKAMQPNYSKTASAIAPNYKSVPKATPLSGISNIAAPTTTALQGFEVANYSGQWQAVNATIRGNQVLLTAADGSILNDLNAMSQVRYLFSGNPKCASMLYNGFNLPASPFITIVE